MNTQTIGERLKTLRTLHNFDITSIADFLEITTDDIKSLEDNTMKLKVSQLERLCDLYNIDEDYIVYGKIPEDFTSSSDDTIIDVKTAYLMNRVMRNLEFINSFKS